MPRATVNINATERIDLESCPGGYVVIKKLTYGEYLTRQDLAMKVQMAEGQGGKAQLEMKGANLVVTCFEMQRCIVEHNLEDDSGNPLNFKVEATTTILDPIIGQEISEAIERMNTLKKNELGNSSSGPSDASPVPQSSTS